MKKFSIIMVAVLLGAALLVSCTAAPEVEVAPTTLVFSSRLFSPPAEQEFFINEIIKPFEAENNVVVNFQIIDDQTLLDRAEVQQSTDHITTDIVVSHNSRMPEWIENGWVEDLTEVVAG